MTAAWILVLTLFGNGKAAVASVPGFSSQAACMTAANAWVAQIKTDYVMARALCVRSA